jgi:uncharacterized damage-inducible protein DinB
MALLDGRCPVCGLDLRTVRPPDALAAIRSYPRRYRRLLVRLDDEQGADIVTRRPGPGEWSALEHAVHVADVIEAVGEALERVQVHDDPSVDIEVRSPRSAPVDDVVRRLTAASDRLMSTAANVTGKDWQRGGRLPSGERVTALSLLRHAVHVGAHHRREVERVLSTVR